MQRRTVLASTGIAVSSALAGCSDLGDEQDEDNDDLEDQDDHNRNGGDEIDEDDGLGGDDSADDTGQDHDEEEEFEIQEEEQGQDQQEEQENTEDDDDEPEVRPDVVLPEEAAEHLDVLNHELESSESGCEFYAELERTSSDESTTSPSRPR